MDVGPFLDRRQPVLGPAGRVAADVVAVARIGQRFVTPQGQRLGQFPVGGVVVDADQLPGPAKPLTEYRRIKIIGRDQQSIAGRFLNDHARQSERSAEAGDQRLQGIDRVGGRIVQPDGGHEFVAGDPPAGLERQPAEQGAQPSTGDLYLTIADQHGQRTENAYPHRRKCVTCYSPERPSIDSRRRSAWPLCRAYSSIMWTSTQRRLRGRPRLPRAKSPGSA